MLKLELDWAGDEMPQFGMDEGNGVCVELVSDEGPSGWPAIAVYAAGESGATSGPRLISWLVNVYGSESDEASELADLAIDV
jgi:hypothetical protein